MTPIAKRPKQATTTKTPRYVPSVEEVTAAIINRLFKRYGKSEKAEALLGQGPKYRVNKISFMVDGPRTVAILEIEGGKRPFSGAAIRNPIDKDRPEAGMALALRRALLDAMRSLKLLKKHAA